MMLGIKIENAINKVIKQNSYSSKDISSLQKRIIELNKDYEKRQEDFNEFLRVNRFARIPKKIKLKIKK